MHILKQADYRRMPWKNGLGVTEEVAAYPPGSDLASFGWRLSIAHVGADGPFSVFAGIDRTIALLDGDGLILDLPDHQRVELTPRSEPFAFSGDVEIASRNSGGKTIDLNIMTRRGQFRHAMRRIACSAPVEIEIAHTRTILIFNGAAGITHRDGSLAIERFDAVLTEPGDGALNITPQAALDVFLVEITELR